MGVNVFLSYPEEYVREADALLRLLGTHNIQCYSFKHTKSLPGTDFTETIQRNLNSANFIVLFWGRESVTKWIEAEIQYAYSLNKKIVPVLVDNSTPLPEILCTTQAVVSYEDPYMWVLHVAFAIGALSKQDYYNQQHQLEEERRRQQMTAVLGAVGVGAIGLGAAAFSAFRNRRNRKKDQESIAKTDSQENVQIDDTNA